jgi:allantoinase
MNERTIRSRRTLLPDGERPAAVRLRAGRIVAIEAYDAPVLDSPDADLGNVALLPGLVDTHVHVNEPGRTQWEGFASATRAAAAGGVTTIVDMPLNSIPPTTSVPALGVKRAAASGQCTVDVGFWGGAVPGNTAELVPLQDAGVYGFKCFLVDSGVPEFPPLSTAQLDEVMALLAGPQVDALLVVHAEDPSGVRPAPASREYADFLASRPPAAETRAIDAVIAAARRSGGRAHILHLSSARALPAIAQAKADGVRVTVETCPHYLTLAAEDVPEGATQFKCCPPVRDRANQDELWQALADGTIDCVVSDHSPCEPALKRPETGDFGDAWGGIASLQLGLPVVWTSARRRGHKLSTVVDWLSRKPADLVGLGRKGRIAVGADADLVAFDPDQAFTVDPARLHHRHPVTPYARQRLTGVVQRTWLRGEPVGDGTPRGVLLARESA